VSLPIASEAARLIESVDPDVPAGMSVPRGTVLMLQAFIDFGGRLRAPAYVSGPEELIDAAVAAAAKWRVAPKTMNGAPILETQNIGVRFGAP